MSDLEITYTVEPADPSVGIMSEGFSAAIEDGDCWCNLDDMCGSGAFTWYANETGDECPRPEYADEVEAALLAYADSYYKDEP